MFKPPQMHWLAGAAVLLCRVLLGLYMLLAGWGKVRGGVGAFVDGSFSKMTPPWLPRFVALPFGYALPWIELIGGALLIVGLFGRVTAAVLGLLLLSITIAVAQSDGITSGPGPFHHAPIFMGLAFLLAALGPGQFSVDDLRGKKG